MSQSFPLCSHNIWLAGVCCCRPPPHLLMMMSSLPVSQAPHSSLGFSKLTSASVQSSALHALEHRMGRADAGVYIKTVVSFRCVLVAAWVLRSLPIQAPLFLVYCLCRRKGSLEEGGSTVFLTALKRIPCRHLLGCPFSCSFTWFQEP